MKKKKDWILNNRGGSYISLIIGFMIIFMIIAIMVKVFPVVTKQRQLHQFVHEVLRTAELTGRIDVEVDGEIARQKSLTGLDPILTFSKSGKIPLGEIIEVTGTITVDIGNGTFGSFSVPITVRATGRSEVYHK